ncbi:hypothetical protein HZH66_001130 [Vespula vulgaris]|uniref:Uncharacterized protein n=1 Tax=Vespula vulgaris TaxID=7454 RepID=A0A834NLF4_VESVU|nr:hypothetical protein HZH66_001130 [Vespula vulgaris]
MFDSATKEAVLLNNIEKVSTRIRNVFQEPIERWGKRNQNIPTSNTNNPRCIPQQARPSLEQLLNLYNFIQIEAQKIVDRQKLNK